MLLYCNSEMLQFAILNMHVVVALLSVLAFACLSLSLAMLSLLRRRRAVVLAFLPRIFPFPTYFHA